MKTDILKQGLKKFTAAIAALICVFLFSEAATAQTYKAAAGSAIKVNGTSNLHDWTMNAQTVQAEGNLVFKGDDLQDITSLTFSLPVNGLKSKEDLMDSRAYKSLKEADFKRISFKLNSATVTGNVVKAIGSLTIAGVTKEVALLAKSTVAADGSISFVGSQKLKMSAFGIKPPTFMMGALKVGDEVDINFNLKLKK